MSHQPYENWILDEPQLSDEEKRDLAAHLRECTECTRLTNGWNTVQRTIQSSQMKPAPADFTGKWSASLARRKREQEKKQARTLVISLSSGAAAVLLAIAIYFLPDFSLISLAAGFISTMLSVSNIVSNFWSISIKLIQTIPLSTLIVTIVIVSGWVLLASITLGLSIWKLAFRRKVQK